MNGVTVKQYKTGKKIVFGSGVRTDVFHEELTELKRQSNCSEAGQEAVFLYSVGIALHCMLQNCSLVITQGCNIPYITDLNETHV